MYSQETRLDTPRGATLVDHQRRAEAEHDGDEVGEGERPGRRASAQALRGDLGRVGVADG